MTASSADLSSSESIVRRAVGYLLAMVAVVTSVRAEPPTDGSPRILEPTYNFGSMVAGPTVEHVFVVVNPTDTPMKVTRIRSSCGCTVGKVEPETVPAHGEANLLVSFHTDSRHGTQRKHIFISTDHPSAHLLRCSVEGELTIPEPKGPTTARPQPQTDPTPTETRPKAQPPARAAAEEPAAEAKTTEVAANTGLHVVASPEAMLFLDVPAGGSLSRSIELRETAGKAFEPKRATSGCQGIRWSFEPLGETRAVWRVTATYQGLDKPQRFRCQGRVLLASGQSVSLFLAGNTARGDTP
jgi:hypothetical protein